MKVPLGKLCIIDISKKEGCVCLNKIKYSEILLGSSYKKEGPQVLYLRFTRNNIKTIWMPNV